MLIKSRKAKVSERGIYLQDSALQQTNFIPGSNYKYVIDSKNKQIIIQTSQDPEDNQVSKRALKEGFKPVIDIRRKEALNLFKGSEYLEVFIYQDRILVEGFSETNETISSYISKDQLASVTREQISFDLFSDVFQTKTVQSAFHNLHIPLQIASLFSGAGVMDQGFKEEGFDIVFALEKDEEAIKTYRFNHGDHVVQADITSFDKSKIIKAPIMIGGSPCQGFSNSNRHSSFLANPNNKLLNEFIQAVKTNENCQVFVLENVPQILTAGDGKFKEEIYQALSDFDITSGVLSSAQFGEAQDRKRAIFIGSKIGPIDLPKAIYPKQLYRTVRMAFSGLSNEVSNQLDYSKGKPETIERMKHVPPGGNWNDIPTHLQTARMKSGNTHSVIYRRLEWDKPCFTIPNPRKNNITHPEEHRTLSIRECARLFGLKDSFVFKGSLSSMQQQICNAVPVKLAKAIAKQIKGMIVKLNLNNRINTSIAN
jgi:DNA (cytosine-5)-methyltransferase 1